MARGEANWGQGGCWGNGRHGCRGKSAAKGIKEEIRIRLMDGEKEAMNTSANERSRKEGKLSRQLFLLPSGLELFLLLGLGVRRI